MELKGRVAIVTGGTTGIGSAICISLAEEGCDVAFTYRKSPPEGMLGKINSFGVRAMAFKADASDFGAAQEVVEKVLKEWGRIDILVCNAGITRDSVIWKMTEVDWDEVISTNLKGYFNYIRAVAPIFKEKMFGKIVNIASINGLRGKFGQANYSASKGGVIALTKTVAKELGRYNVNVNAVAPGMVKTEMAKNLPPEVLQQAVNETVLGRIAEPEDIAKVVVFLCTEKARHITGEIIKVDGGQYI